MKKIVRLTESDIDRIVKKVINEENKTLVNEALTSKDGTYKLYAQSGWLKDNKGNTMCIKVDATWPFGTFAQGVTNAWRNKDGSAVIQPKGSKIGNIELSSEEVESVLKSLKSGGTFKTSKGGATIYIGKNLVQFCKKEWSS